MSKQLFGRKLNVAFSTKNGNWVRSASVNVTLVFDVPDDEILQKASRSYIIDGQRPQRSLSSPEALEAINGSEIPVSMIGRVDTWRTMTSEQKQRFDDAVAKLDAVELEPTIREALLANLRLSIMGGAK